MSREKEHHRIFYSWQDDIARKDNRNFIEDALKKAIKNINKDDALVDELIIDRDTKGVAGAPLIAETILGKIDIASVFVADVSIIGKADSGKPITNPNVMAEFGYALKTLAEEALVLVINESYGRVEDLPFDLRHRRIMRYCLPPSNGKDDEASTAERREVAKALQGDLEKALRTWIATRIRPTSKAPIEEFDEYLLDAGSFRRAVRVLGGEVDRFLKELDAISQSKISQDESPEGVFTLMNAYEKAASDLLPIFIRACHEDDGGLTQPLVRSLTTISHPPAISHSLGEPQLYPALLMLYAGGISALAGNRLSTLVALLRQVKIRTKHDSKGASASRHLTPHRVFDERVAKYLPPVKANYTPISTYFFSILREPLRLVIKVDAEYAELFYLFEYLFALASAQAHKEVWGVAVAPTGSYVWEKIFEIRPISGM